MKTSDWILLLAVGAAGYFLYKKIGGAANVISSAQDKASTAVSDFAYGIFGPDESGVTQTPALTSSGSDKYAAQIFVVKNGNLTTPVPLARAASMVQSQGYTWGKNPALGYFDRIYPPA